MDGVKGVRGQKTEGRKTGASRQNSADPISTLTQEDQFARIFRKKNTDSSNQVR